MWKCSKCAVEHEDNFDSCWKCGEKNVNFRVEENDTTNTELSLDEQLAARFKCSRCAHEEAVTKRIAVTGDGLSRLVDIQHNVFIAVSCTRCGKTDLFNTEVLEGADVLGAVLDAIF